MPWSAVVGISGILQLDDGTANNRLGLWLQPGTTALSTMDSYGAGTADVQIARGAVTPLVPFKLAAAYTARNAAVVMNGGTAALGTPLHWPGLLFTRMLIGSSMRPAPMGICSSPASGAGLRIWRPPTSR